MITTHGAGNHFGRGNLAPLVKVSAIVICLIMLGCLAIAAGEFALSHPNSTIGMAANFSELTAVPEPATAAPGSRLSTIAAPAGVVRDDSRRQSDAPPSPASSDPSPTGGPIPGR